jgi:hypothetical protein
MHVDLPVPCYSSGSQRGSLTSKKGPDEHMIMGHTTGPIAAGTWEGHIRNLSRYWWVTTATWLYKNLFLSDSLNKIATTLLDLKIQYDFLATMVLVEQTYLGYDHCLSEWDLCHVRRRMLC